MANTHAEIGAADRNTAEVNDRELLDRYVAARDESAFARLVDRHGGTIWRLCRRIVQKEHDAEDAYQAVFIVLSRKASSIRRGEAVGSWLYSVAYRIAMKARVSVQRRQKLEGPTTDVAGENSPWSAAALSEMQRILDEEVDRLGEKYRAPFVLCCLEGMSKPEAARELDWPEPTVKARLAHAKSLLQTRLVRRGITLSAVLTAVALVQNTAAAAAPAVLAITAGNAATLSAPALALADSLAGSMAFAKLKATIAALAATTVLFTSVGLYAVFHSAETQTPEEQKVMFVRDDPVMFLPPAAPVMPAHDEQVLAVAFSPDGKRLVTAGARHTLPGQLIIWDVENHTELVRLRDIRGVRGVAYSPDGNTIACGAFGGAIQLRDAETGKERCALEGHTFGVNAVAYSADGNLLASAGLDRSVKLWDVNKLAEKKSFVGHIDMVFSVAFFRHGKAIVTGSQDRTAKIWDIESGKVKFDLTGHAGAVEAVAVTPDDKTVATASWDGTIKLWDADTGKEQAVLRDEGWMPGRTLKLPIATNKDQAAPSGEPWIYAVAFSPDGTQLASSAADGSTRIWDVKTRKTFKRFGGHTSSVWSVAFAPNGKTLATGSSDRTAKLWDVETGKEIATLATAQLKRVRALAYAPDGRSLASAGEDMHVQVRDAESGNIRLVLAGHSAVVNCIAISPDGATLASGSSDKSIKLWDLASGQEKRTLHGHAGAVHAVAFAKDGKLASAGEDKLVKWWDLADENETLTLKGHAETVFALAFSLDGQTLASGGGDRIVRVWTRKNPASSRGLSGHMATVRALAFGADGLLASAGDDGTVRLWHPVADKGHRTLNGHAGPVHSLTFTAGGRTLVSGGADKNFVVWNPVTLQWRITPHGHKGAITALAIHPHGDHLITGSDDAKLLRWQSAVSATPARVLKTKANAVTFAKFSPATDRLATGGVDGSVTFWARTLMPAMLPFPSLDGVFWDADFSPDGRTVALARESNVQIMDVASGTVLKTLPMDKPARSVKFSADKKYLAVTTGSSKAPDAPYEAKLFDTVTWKELATMNGHTGTVLRAAFSPDGKTLATIAADRTTKLWEVPTGKLLATMETRSALAKGLLFLPDGTLVTSSWDKTIRFWDTEKKSEKKKWDTDFTMTTLALSADGALLAAAEHPSPGNGPAELRIWDVATGKVVLQPTGHKGRVLGLAFTLDGRGLIACGGKLNSFGEIHHWDIATGQLRGAHTTPGQWIENVAVSPDGRRVASTSSSALRFWDLDFLHNERTWVAHSGSANAGVFANDGATLVTAGQDKAIKVWGVRDARLIATLDGHTKPVHALAMLPDGKTLASAGEDFDVKLWDLALGQEKASLAGHTKSVHTLAASPDGKTLASGGGDASVPGQAELILWNLDALKPRKTFNDLERAVLSLAYSPDGKSLAAAIAQDQVRVWSTDDDGVKSRLHVANPRSLAFSTDGKLLAVGEGTNPTATEAGAGSVHVWDVASWKERSTLEKHRHVVTSVAFSPDGHGIVSASQDGVIKLHPIPTGSLSTVSVHAPDKAPAPKQVDPLVNLHVPLKGKPANLPKMKLVGSNAANCVRFEPEGLRITLPAGFEGSRPQVGLSTGIVLKGDFEITVAYEILHLPDAADAGADTPLVLWLWSLGGERKVTGVSRRMVINDGPQFVAFAATVDHLGNTTHTMGQTIPAAAKTGQLRLVRVGREMFYFVSEGIAAEFKLLHRFTVGDQDMDDIRLIASTCDPKGSLDARFSDLRIRSGSDLPVPTTPGVEPVAGDSAIATNADSRWWLATAAMLACVFAALAGIAFVIRLRRSRVEYSVSAPIFNKPPALTASVSFACACGKALKAKAELAGKKLKCPACAAPVLVPGTPTP